jgi:hypothetical protein
LFALPLSLPVTASGQAAVSVPQKDHQLSIGLHILTHGERRNGGLIREGDTEGEDEANFLMNRTRLTLDYRKNFNPADATWGRTSLEAKIVAQNSGIWGMKGNNAFNLYEAWAKLTDKTGLFLQVGRQALAYDDERIIGPNDWAMAALSHDVLRLGYEGHGHKAHVILAYNQNADNVNGGSYFDKANGAQPYKTMHTLWYHYDLPKTPLGISFLLMNVGMQAGVKGGKYGNTPRTEYQGLVGGYASFRPDQWSLEGAYYRQIGKNEEGQDIKAWMASILAKWRPSKKYGLKAGYDCLSGDDYMVVRKPGTIGMILHEVPKGFMPLYGSHTKFYGILDYFYTSAYSFGFTPGLQNAFVGVYGKPTSKLALRATYHYLAVATKLNNLNSTLGHSIDLQGSYSFTKDISLTAGYTMMFGTETMDRLKQGRSSKTARWGWFSLVISPRLFTTRF